MKSLATHWLGFFVFFLIGLGLFGGSGLTVLTVRQSAFLAMLLGTVIWLRREWAPEFYRKRQERKAKEPQP